MRFVVVPGLALAGAGCLDDTSSRTQGLEARCTATVITADLPLAGQLAPGDWIEFEICTRPQAISALIAQEGAILALQ